MNQLNKTKFLDIWRAQTHVWSIRIKASITSSKVLLFAILQGETFPSLPQDMAKANFIWFYLWENHITYSWMMVEDKNKWTWVIDILFYTSLRIIELLWIENIDTVVIKKPSISKKLLKWWARPINSNYIKWRIHSIGPDNMSSIELLIPESKSDEKIRNTSSWAWNHKFYQIKSKKIVWKNSREYNWSWLIPMQTKFEFSIEDINIQWLIKNIKWKYRLSQKQIKSIR